jgi:hypothetical protein
MIKPATINHGSFYGGRKKFSLPMTIGMISILWFARDIEAIQATKPAITFTVLSSASVRMATERVKKKANDLNKKSSTATVTTILCMRKFSCCGFKAGSFPINVELNSDLGFRIL